MVHKIVVQVVLATALVAALTVSGNATSVIFSTGNTTNLMAAASRPDTPPGSEIETADDFFLTNDTVVTGATVTGLITGTNPAVSGVTAEIYQIFPADSNTARTSFPTPPFSTSQVPARMNSPSDVALDSRSSGSGLTFMSSVLNMNFTALNSIAVGGIHPLPGQATGGNGAVTGQEVQFHLTFTTPFDLAAGHYFFVPQVETTGGGNFFWLSADRPITTAGTPFPGTPFPAGTADLQGWTRDAALDPDWLRVGTDIVDTVGVPTAPTFNFSFQLEGNAVPLPATLPLFATGIGALGLLGWRRQLPNPKQHKK
jgi:hypothetical protein